MGHSLAREPNALASGVAPGLFFGLGQVERWPDASANGLPKRVRLRQVLDKV